MALPRDISLLAFVVSLCFVACQGETLTLGSSNTETGGAASSGGSPTVPGSPDGPGGGATVAPFAFSDVAVVFSLSSAEKDDNPTLSADLRTVCFTSSRDGGVGDMDVWCSKRDDRQQPFGAPVNISTVNTRGFESSAALSLDGTTLWFGSEDPTGTAGVDIFQSTRASLASAWETPSRVSELNSDSDEIPRPTALVGTVMPMSRRVDGTYRIFFASRNTAESSFSEPMLVPELGDAEHPVADAQLSEDGLSLLFTFTDPAGDPGQIYYAERGALDQPFSKAQPVEGINTDADDRDPWLSPDGSTLFFSSNRSGDFEIYQANRVLP